MVKYVYPAIFTKEEVGYSVKFPDLECCYTSGVDQRQAVEMAKDVLYLTLYWQKREGKEIPKPSAVSNVQHGNDEFVSLVSCELYF